MDGSRLTNATFENYVAAGEGYSEMAFQISSHVLTLGYAAMFAALLFFAMTYRRVAPKYRMSSILSGVVMVSAALLLYAQAQNWSQLLAWNATVGRYTLVDGADLFNNGYRYLNWLIDVPMLLFQILFVVELTDSRKTSIRNQFWFSGAGMIVTGYIGQFYEVSNPAVWLGWGAVSTLFFLHILYVMRTVVTEGRVGIASDAQKTLGAIWWLFLVSWMLYPGAYLMPLLLDGEAGVVGRHMTYTAADISSKIVYGVLLTVLATQLSEAQGWRADSSDEADRERLAA
jgi:bacteriorhodopsin